VEQFRQDERRRQRDSRARRRGQSALRGARAGPEPTGQDVTACHAPASACNPPEMLKKVQHLWDRQVRLSRASLDRELERMGQKFGAMVSVALGGAGT
jgi:hypothetical protein